MNAFSTNNGILFILKTITLGASVVLFSCSQEQAKPPIGKNIVNVTEMASSSELADAGEQLVSPYAFMYADKVFDQAIAKDPNNKKALFYKNMLAPIMVYKGILTRIRPLARSENKLDQVEKFIKNLPNSGLRAFLLDGRENITVETLQDLAVDYRNALNEFRLFLKHNNDLDLTLNMNPYLFKNEILEKVVKNCKAQENSPNVYETECDVRNVMEVSFSAADAMALQQALAGMVLFYTVPTSYDLSKAMVLSKNQTQKKWTAKQLVQLIHSEPSFAPLRADNSMNLIEELGSDFVAASKWVLKNQSELCPGNKSENARQGHFFENGICIGESALSKTEQVLNDIEKALAGPISASVSTSKGAYQTTVDYSALSRRPIKDLNLLVPTEIDKCGNATNYKDSTFGGILPNGDWSMFSESKCSNLIVPN